MKCSVILVAYSLYGSILLKNTAIFMTRETCFTIYSGVNVKSFSICSYSLMHLSHIQQQKKSTITYETRFTIVNARFK